MFPGKGIIYSSGFTAKVLENQGFPFNEEDLLSKPYDLDDLYQRVSLKLKSKKSKTKK